MGDVYQLREGDTIVVIYRSQVAQHVDIEKLANGGWVYSEGVDVEIQFVSAEGERRTIPMDKTPW